MSQITFDILLARFDGPAHLAGLAGMSYGAAKQAFRRRSIPSTYWQNLAAYKLVTLAELAQAAAPSGIDGAGDMMGVSENLDVTADRASPQTYPQNESCAGTVTNGGRADGELISEVAK